MSEMVREVAELIVSASKAGYTIYAAGNGGSHAQAEHLVAELMGKFQETREPIAAFCLGSNSAVLTCIANDFGYDEVFSRQVRTMAAGDVLFLLSTSGQSENVVKAASMAHAFDVTTVAIAPAESNVGAQCEYVFDVHGSTASKQEQTLAILHSICSAVEDLFDE